MTRNLPDVHLFREGGSPGEVVDANQLDQGLGRAVDHRVRDDPGLTKRCTESQSREDEPGGNGNNRLPSGFLGGGAVSLLDS